MKILILGATGRTGKWVLEAALEKGYQVHCLSRNSQRIGNHQNVKIFEGDPLNENDLKEALQGCQALVSVLNISRKTDFPWSKLRTPKTFLSDFMAKLIPLATQLGVDRIALCSAWGVAESANDIPKWFKWFIDNSNIGYAYADHERQENCLIASNLDWTIVRPVGLSNSKKEESIKESFENIPKPGLLISRKSLGKYLVNSLENDSLIGKKVVVSAY